MPNNLVFVRHGQSEANVIQQAEKNGTPIHLTDDMVNVPDRSWRLTDDGVNQAKTIGTWINDNIGQFNRHITSPFTRTRETSAHLNLREAVWEENRTVRERSWGEIGSIPRKEFNRLYPHNSLFKKVDPLYWSPPAGESIANISETRARNLLEMLANENSKEDVLVTTHGEFIWSSRLIIERWSDEEFIAYDKDPNYKVHNCMVVHYTRIDPKTNKAHTKFRWVRTAYPVFDEDKKTWTVKENDFKEFSRSCYSSEELLERAESRSRFLI